MCETKSTSVVDKPVIERPAPKPKLIITEKLCIQCNTVKKVEGGYYRCGKYWQKLCKICHNANRTGYKYSNKEYVKKPTGFLKLPAELQEKIKYDIETFINFKDICRKYSKEYPQLKYQSLLAWERKGLIPRYVKPKEI